jgi:hypothetical protein
MIEQIACRERLLDLKEVEVSPVDRLRAQGLASSADAGSA